jgi:hypothetical protein
MRPSRLGREILSTPYREPELVGPAGHAEPFSVADETATSDGSPALDAGADTASAGADPRDTRHNIAPAFGDLARLLMAEERPAAAVLPHERDTRPGSPRVTPSATGHRDVRACWPSGPPRDASSTPSGPLIVRRRVYTLGPGACSARPGARGNSTCSPGFRGARPPIGDAGKKRLARRVDRTAPVTANPSDATASRPGAAGAPP